MTIGIDISQLAYPSKTGVYNYLYNLVAKLLEDDKKIIMFYSFHRSEEVFPLRLRLNLKTVKMLKLRNTNFLPHS